MGLVKQMLVRLLGGLGTKEEGFTRVGTVAIRYSFICFCYLCDSRWFLICLKLGCSGTSSVCMKLSHFGLIACCRGKGS